MMLDETNAELRVIELHDQARKCKNDKKAKELRKQADDLSALIKEEKNAVYRLHMGL